MDQATTPTGSSNSLPPYTMHDMKELMRPKSIDIVTFKPLLKHWLKEMRTPVPPLLDEHEREQMLAEVRNACSACRDMALANNDLQFSQLDREFMSHFPLKEDELKRISYLLPTKETKYKPPHMRFGWLLHPHELKELALSRHRCFADVSREVYKPDYPNIPEGARFDAELGMYVLESKSIYAPTQTAEALLQAGRIECGLGKKYRGYFSTDLVWNGIDRLPSETVFISIYSNIDLCKQDPARHKKGPVPTHSDIKKMQEWLGLGEDREPGWWFMLEDFKKMTWDRYRWELEQDGILKRRARPTR